MSDYYDSIYEHFKMYFNADDRDIDHWESGLGPEILVYHKNGQVIRFDDMDKTIYYVVEHPRDEYGDYAMNEEIYRNNFSMKLRRIMRSRGVNQKLLSESTGIKSPTLSRYMTGHNLPDLRNASRICRALDCSIEDLMDFD